MTNTTAITFVAIFAGIALVYILVGLFVGKAYQTPEPQKPQPQRKPQKSNGWRLRAENEHLKRQVHRAVQSLNAIRKQCECKNPRCSSRIAYEALRGLVNYEIEAKQGKGA